MQDESAYRELQQHLDQLPVGFPATDSGVEIRLLKHIFTAEEARIALKLRSSFESLQDIFKRVEDDITLEELETTLDRIAKKGGIISKKEGEKRFYRLAIWIIGMYEHQVHRLTKEFLADVSQYNLEAYGLEMFSTGVSQFRTIPVGKSISPKHEVATYDDVRKLIENIKGPIAVTECICRKGKDLLGDPCKQTDLREVCLPFGDFAQYYIDQEMGREVSKEYALELVHKAEEEGMVIQPGNSQKPGFICLCCGCCCGFISGLKVFPRPIDFFVTNYYAEVDAELCEGCGTCLEICQMDALTIIADVSTVNRDRCIGCGLCVAACPEEAIELRKKAIEFVPPKDEEALIEEIRIKKAELRP